MANSGCHKLLNLLYIHRYVNILCVVFCTYIAPVCFNTTYCEGESVSDDLMSFDQCCFELPGISFASSGQCLLCPQRGMYGIEI